MASTLELKTYLPPETKQLVQSIARQQQMSEAAWLRRLIDGALQTAGVTSATPSEGPIEHAKRATRLMIRLRQEDQLLLQARATGRGMPMATYASMLLRAHLRDLAPLPTQELAVLKRAIAELG